MTSLPQFDVQAIIESTRKEGRDTLMQIYSFTLLVRLDLLQTSRMPHDKSKAWAQSRVGVGSLKN